MVPNLLAKHLIATKYYKQSKMFTFVTPKTKNLQKELITNIPIMPQQKLDVKRRVPIRVHIQKYIVSKSSENLIDTFGNKPFLNV